MRVCMYGGTRTDGTPVGFVSAVAEKIVSSLPAVIVTGGYVGPDQGTTDCAALAGARRAAEARPADLSSVFEAWLPGARSGDDKGLRMSRDLGITVRELPGRTALGRRLSMVSGVDVVVTFAGKQNTALVLEQAIELGVPALPIAATGGTSRTVYNIYQDRIEAAFAPGAVRRCFDVLAGLGLDDPRSVAAVAEVIRSARLGRCLVLQPYRAADEQLYTSALRPAIEEEMIAVRLKDAAGSQQIYASFFEAVSHSTAIIADITELNENVMYEVGYAHGRGLQPLLFTLDASRIQSLPVYLRTLNVHAVTAEELPDLIRSHLRAVKRGAGHPSPALKSQPGPPEAPTRRLRHATCPIRRAKPRACQMHRHTRCCRYDVAQATML